MRPINSGIMDVMSRKRKERDMYRENIGENLRRIRHNRRGLSVAAVVDIINANGYEMSVDTYYKWERGTRKPPCEAIPYIAQALKTTEEMIFHFHERKTESVGSVKSRPVEEMIEMYEQMNDQDQRLISALMRSLNKKV